MSFNLSYDLTCIDFDRYEFNYLWLRDTGTCNNIETITFGKCVAVYTYIHTFMGLTFVSPSVRPSVHPCAFVSQRSKCEKKKNSGADGLIQQPASQPAYKWMSICTFEVSLNELNLIKTTTTTIIIINIRLFLWLTSRVYMVWILKMNPRRQTSWNAAM